MRTEAARVWLVPVCCELRAGPLRPVAV